MFKGLGLDEKEYAFMLLKQRPSQLSDSCISCRDLNGCNSLSVKEIHKSSSKEVTKYNSTNLKFSFFIW